MRGVRMSVSSNTRANKGTHLARMVANLHQVPIGDLSTEIIKILNYINNLNIVYDENNNHKAVILAGHSVIDHWILLSTVIEGQQIDELMDKDLKCVEEFFREYGLASDSVIMYDGTDKSIAPLVTGLQFDGFNLCDVGANFIYTV